MLPWNNKAYLGPPMARPTPLRSLPNAYFRFRWMALWPLHACAGRLPFLGPCSVGELLAAGAMAAGAATWAAGTYGREASGEGREGGGRGLQAETLSPGARHGARSGDLAPREHDTAC